MKTVKSEASLTKLGTETFESNQLFLFFVYLYRPLSLKSNIYTFPLHFLGLSFSLNCLSDSQICKTDSQPHFHDNLNEILRFGSAPIAHEIFRMSNLVQSGPISDLCGLSKNIQTFQGCHVL